MDMTNVDISTGKRKTFAVYNNQPEYMRDSEGNVYKFIFGYMNLSRHNRLKIVGKVDAKNLPNDFDSSLYDVMGWSPVKGAIYPTDDGLFIWEC